MSPEEMAQKALAYSESEMIRGMINRTLIIEWGTIKEVLGGGSVVNVLLSVTDRPENTTIVTCVLISPCSNGMSINFTPKAGDKVLVLSPRRYNINMFDVSTAEEDDTEVIVQANSKGYNKVTCLALLYNQFRTDTHKNFIDFTEGTLTAGLAYNKDDDKDLVTVSVNADGEIALVSNDTSVSIDKDGAIITTTPKATFNIDKDGYLAYTNTDDNKSQIAFTSSGVTLQDKNGCKIASSSTSIVINDNLEILK